MNDLTLATALKNLIDCFGKNILLDKQKCISTFKDQAPMLKDEQKILDMALKLDVGEFFFNGNINNEQAAAIRKSIHAMDGILSKETIKEIVYAFVIALKWDITLLSGLFETDNNLLVNNSTSNNTTTKKSISSNTSSTNYVSNSNMSLQNATIHTNNSSVSYASTNVSNNNASINSSSTNVSVNNSSIGIDSANTSINNIQTQKSGNKRIVGLIAMLLFVFALGGYFFLGKNKEVSRQHVVKPTYETQQKQQPIKQPVLKQQGNVQKSNIDLAKEELARMGYPNSPLTATTYGQSNNGFLVFEHKFIWVVDTKNNHIACLLNTAEVIGYYKLYRKKNINNPLILKFGVVKDKHDKDAKNGSWDKDFHIIPVYAQYEFNTDGTMNDKGLTSGEGENPVDYRNYLYEQKNVDMVNIFLNQLAFFDSNVFNTFPIAKDTPKIAKVITKPESGVTNHNSAQARDAFLNFHIAITNRKLGDAYNILSPDYQKFMRGYENFARGYDTTLRSDVIELNTLREDNDSASFSYKLKAVDREGNGTKTQYFSGKVKLVKINGVWRIDNTEAKRL